MTFYEKCSHNFTLQVQSVERLKKKIEFAKISIKIENWKKFYEA